MKKTILLTFLAFSLFAADFDWILSLQKAKEIAKRRHKPIMVMIYQKGCHMCEYMDEVTFESEPVVEFVQMQFVPVKLQVNEAAKEGLKAYGTPTFYFLDEKGERVTRPLVGAAAPKLFLEKLKQIKGKIDAH